MSATTVRWLRLSAMGIASLGTVLYPGWQGKPLPIGLSIGIFIVLFALLVLIAESGRSKSTQIGLVFGIVYFTHVMLTDSWVANRNFAETVVGSLYMAVFAGGLMLVTSGPLRGARRS